MAKHHIDVVNLSRIATVKRDRRAPDDPPRPLGVAQECRQPRQSLPKSRVGNQSGFFATATSAGRSSRSFIV